MTVLLADFSSVTTNSGMQNECQCVNLVLIYIKKMYAGKEMFVNY